MEVHHHPDLHHKKKKWKEYVIEFLMIFLAVTLGFFAETIREHISEKHREKVGHTIKFGNGFRAEYAAFEAAQAGKKFQTRCTPMEKGLISAIGKRYSADTTYDLKKLQSDYSESMRSLVDAFPKNADVITLFADALMLEHPWDLYDAALQPKPWTPQIRSVLRKALAIDLLHPGAQHFMIHTVEGSLHPEEGVGSAELLAGLMPDVAHAVHMPSHIYIRSGNYKKGIDVNDKAIRSYDKYRRRV